MNINICASTYVVMRFEKEEFNISNEYKKIFNLF